MLNFSYTNIERPPTFYFAAFLILESGWIKRSANGLYFEARKEAGPEPNERPIIIISD